MYWFICITSPQVRFDCINIEINFFNTTRISRYDFVRMRGTCSWRRMVAISNIAIANIWNVHITTASTTRCVIINPCSHYSDASLNWSAWKRTNCPAFDGWLIWKYQCMGYRWIPRYDQQTARLLVRPVLIHQSLKRTAIMLALTLLCRRGSENWSSWRGPGSQIVHTLVW